jgi:hypothetical protein
MDPKIFNNAPITLTFIISNDESHFRLTVGRSVCLSHVELMTRFLSGLSCAAEDQIFVRSVLSCGNDNQFLSGLSCAAVDQIFVRSVLSCGADAQIFVWSVLWGWWPDFCLVCLVRLLTRFLSGQSCLVGLMPRFLFGLTCAADDQIYFCPVSLVLWGWCPDFCLVWLVRLMTRFTFVR